MNRDRAEMLDGIKTLEEILNEDTFVDTNKEACIKATKKLDDVLARYMSSEASTIV